MQEVEVMSRSKVNCPGITDEEERRRVLELSAKFVVSEGIRCDPDRAHGLDCVQGLCTNLKSKSQKKPRTMRRNILSVHTETNRRSWKKNTHLFSSTTPTSYREYVPGKSKRQLLVLMVPRKSPSGRATTRAT